MRYEISGWQLSMLFACVHLAVFVSYSPGIASMLPPSRDAWLSVLIAAVPGFILAFVAYALVKRFPGENLYAFSRIILGRFFGTIVNIAMAVYFIHWTTIITREFSQFMESVVYLRTPNVVFDIMFLTLAVVGASQQIEFIGRTAALSGLLIILGSVILIVANIPQIDLGMLRPFLGEGWQPVLQQAIGPAVAVFSEVVWVVLLAVPYLNKLSVAPRAMGIGIGLNTVLGCLGTATMLAIFGPELISILVFVPLSAARIIQIGDVLERLEWILLLLWFGAMGVKVSLLLWGARLGVSSLFPRWSVSTSLLIVATLAFIWSLFLLPTLTDILNFFQTRSLMMHMMPLPFLMIVLMVVALIRGVTTTKNEAQQR